LSEQKGPLPGYVRARKPLDFGNNDPTKCFDLEEAVGTLACEVVTQPDNKKSLVARPVFLVDPCQTNQSPLKTQTLQPVAFAANANSAGNNTLAGTFTGRIAANQNLSGQASASTANYQILEDFQNYLVRISASNAAQTIILDTRGLINILAIHSDSTGGTSTLVVSGSVDATNYLQLDSIATAAVTDLQYTLATNALNGAAQAGTVAGTGASTVKLNPLAFRYVKIVIGAAGVGITNVTTVAMK
jgi:hypothetical protein